MLFGLLPVYGAYYLQTKTIDVFVLFPAIIVGILIFLVILINEFPDFAADSAVNKRTLVVHFGPVVSVWVYRIALAISFILAVVMLMQSSMFFAGCCRSAANCPQATWSSLKSHLPGNA